jgi:LPS export ABC transporter protein LptC
MKRLLFFVAFMTLGTFALLQLLVREPSGPAPAAPAQAQVSNVLDMNTVAVKQLLGEHVRWELQADHATYNENTDAGVLDQVRFRVYEAAAKNGAPQSFTGRSRQAFLVTSPGSLVLQGDVVLTRDSRMEIRSERVEYDAERQLLTAPGPVHVETPDGVQEGAGLRYFIAEERLEFERPVFYQ